MEAAEFATLVWVDRYNIHRLLERIGNLPPAEAEACYYAQFEAPTVAALIKPANLRQGRGGSEAFDHGGTLMTAPQFILTLSCPNRAGIVAAVATAIFDQGGDIREAQQYGDRGTGRFFMRVVFATSGEARHADVLREAFAPVAERFAMLWTLRDVRVPRRVMMLVSKPDHCLADLLYRHRIGELPMELCAIVSNHPAETFARIDLSGVPFHHLPVAPETKLEQETALWQLILGTGTELVVLARYMQVLSQGLATNLAGRCINIHHSFLPGFKGAKPYHQAFERGVKLIGATAHYVTSDLDEGPIIEQDVERVTHADTPEDLIRKGRDIERRVLARAVAWHLEDRVLLNGHKTVIFS